VEGIAAARVRYGTGSGVTGPTSALDGGWIASATMIAHPVALMSGIIPAAAPTSGRPGFSYAACLHFRLM
jgi:hypothetical protein